MIIKRRFNTNKRPDRLKGYYSKLAIVITDEHISHITLKPRPRGNGTERALFCIPCFWRKKAILSGSNLL